MEENREPLSAIAIEKKLHFVCAVEEDKVHDYL